MRNAVIYSANASGKSNFLKAIWIMNGIILNSAKRYSTSDIEVEKPFFLSTKTENKPSYFEVLFLLNHARYRYGFEVDHKIVSSEWLFEAKKNMKKFFFFEKMTL
ncbi:AAA family ATPase [Larkinella sp. VNQ87]|uniref:AAA family ATPase n=1 Tax=Larkinella sp. VNQ87 TaxID=3400921 RepID=UPI003C06EAFB